jgi:alpha-ketoglutarate-dependent taurine dioxygenase
LRTRTWEPIQTVEEKVEMEVETDKTIVQTLEKKPYIIKAALKRKFIDLLKEKANIKELLEEIID